MRLGFCLDHLDLSNLALGESVARRIVQIEIAVERNPQSPDYSGLAIVEGGATSERGAARVSKFREHISNRQKERGNILRQERLYRDENKFRKGDGKGKQDKEGKKNKKDKKDKKKDGEEDDE